MIRMKRARGSFVGILVVLSTPTVHAEFRSSMSEDALDAPSVYVIGKRDNLESIPGSGHILGRQQLDGSKVFTGGEALRKIPGVNVRDEEGIGLRPNIGIRGLNPTRSTKITLLEDGIPLSYAPYGDNATFYSPAVNRFERVEVMKGAGQLLFGPQTIGGVINYITADPSQEFKGLVSLTGGNRDYTDAQLRLSGGGFLLDYSNRQSDGSRDNTHTVAHDLNLKTLFRLDAEQALILRGSLYDENSNVTYTGITDNEFNNLGPRYNPFKYDNFKLERYAVSATHDYQIDSRSSLKTNVYAQRFNRDFWRQSSATNDNQCDASYPSFQADRRSGIAVDVDRCLSRQGRLRSYYFYGIEPRYALTYDAIGMENELDAGFKIHFENQDRSQLNGTQPNVKSGNTVAENTLRKTEAYSFYAQNRFGLGKWAVTPGLRLEHIRNEFNDELKNQRVEDTTKEWIPSLGATFNPTPRYTLFAGVHRGFAPSRTEDIINGTTGTSTNVEAEKSTNYELGVRAMPFEGAHLQATLFRNEFQRLISVGRIANGSIPLSQGEALFQGVEVAADIEWRVGVFLLMALTHLPTAEQTTSFRQVVNGAVVAGSEAGKRQPYAPENTATLGLGYGRAGFKGQVELVYVGEQYADFANTEAPIPNGDGQRGKLEAYTIYNLALNYRIAKYHTSVFFAVKNIADKVYIVDRTRGIQVGIPRLLQMGLKYEF